MKIRRIMRYVAAALILGVTGILTLHLWSARLLRSRFELDPPVVPFSTDPEAVAREMEIPSRRFVHVIKR